MFPHRNGRTMPSPRSWPSRATHRGQVVSRRDETPRHRTGLPTSNIQSPVPSPQSPIRYPDRMARNNGYTSARKAMHSTAEERERAFLVGVQVHSERDKWRGEASLGALSMLAETAGAVVVGTALQRMDSPNPASYIGKGKLEEIRKRASD